MGDPPVDVVHRHPAPRIFNPDDRCDQCGAQAYAASYHGMRELLWCWHHYRDHAQKLVTEADLVIVDVSGYKALK